MTFEEACELARVINGNPRFAVICIGRFALQTELQTAYRQAVVDQLPWGVSVMYVEDVDDRAVIYRESDWRQFAQEPREPVKQQPAATQPAKPKVQENQLNLF